jgi:DNA-binding PadR family transcriptional regulator
MIELGLLGLLVDQDLHGYELRKQLGELLGSWSTLSFGSLYPALSRLEKAGLVLAVDRPADAVGPDVPVEPMAGPMTGALSGELAAFRSRRTSRARPKGRRAKKVYAITDAGRQRFDELLADPSPDDERSFAVKVAFCRHLAPAERIALFERRRRAIADLLETRRRPGERRPDPYLRSLRDRDARALAHDLVWIDELIAATTETLTPPPAVPTPETTLPADPAPAHRGQPAAMRVATAPDHHPSPTESFDDDVVTIPRGVLADASKEGSP